MIDDASSAASKDWLRRLGRAKASTTNHTHMIIFLNKAKVQHANKWLSSTVGTHEGVQPVGKKP